MENQISERTPFQVTTEAVVAEILRRHRIDCTFRPAGYVGEMPWLSASFVWRGQDHEVEIYEDTTVLLVGDSLFEVYLPAEFVSDQAYIAGFAQRLDRYLSGGDWAGPEEAGAVARSMWKLWSRLKRWRSV